MKRTSLLRYEEEAFEKAAESVAVLAECEGLEGHARSALIRKEVLTRRRNGATKTESSFAAAPPREKGSL